MNEPIAELEIVLASTSALTPADRERAALIGTLKPIVARIPGHLKYAREIVVNNADEASCAASYRDIILLDADHAETALREFDNKLMERLFKTHRAWTALVAQFGVLADAAKRVKQAVIGWQTAEQEKAEQERQRLQAEADERARRERERLEKEAAKLKTPELREQRLEQAAAVIAPVVHVSTPAPAVKVQRRWRVTAVDVKEFVKAASQDDSLLGYLTLETGKLERTKASNSMFEANGVQFTHVTV